MKTATTGQVLAISTLLAAELPAAPGALDEAATSSEMPTVTIFRADQWLGDIFPWRFRIQWKGITYDFGGIPNKCASKREAAARASWRVRWLLAGTYERHYNRPWP